MPAWAPAHTWGMQDIVRKKNTGEPGNRGEFGTVERAPSGLNLENPAGGAGDDSELLQRACTQIAAESASYGSARVNHDGAIRWLMAADTDPAAAREFAQRIVDTAPRNLPPDPTWAPAAGVPRGDSMHSRAYGGRSLPVDGGYRSMAEVNKLIRSDIKAAVEGGYLPADLTYRVRKNHASGTSITAEGVSVEDYFDRREVNTYSGWNTLQPSPFVREVESRLAAIAWQYNYDGSDSMTDYFDRGFYEHVRVLSPVDAAQSEVYAARERWRAVARFGEEVSVEAAEEQLRAARARFEEVVGQVRAVAEQVGATWEEPHRF